MAKQETNQEREVQISTESPICGIIMPISDTPNYRSGHWQDVVKILNAAIEEGGYTPKIVSDSEVSNVIQNEIIKNIADNPLIICDVSSNNANVLFELGLRLAFDKATIIIKDYDTKFNFDLGPIRHIEYPKDLRFTEITDFHEKLVKAIKATTMAFNEGKYTTYLQSFTTYKPKLEQEEVTLKEYLDIKLNQLNSTIQNIKADSEITNITHNDVSLVELGRKFEEFLAAVPNYERYLSAGKETQFSEFLEYLRHVEPYVFTYSSKNKIKTVVETVITSIRKARNS